MALQVLIQSGPERQKTYEIGAEIRFLNSEINLEVAYYNTLCTDQIARVQGQLCNRLYIKYN